MVRQLDHGADCTSKRFAAPLRDRTAWRNRCAVSHGSPPSATSPHSRRPPRCARRRHSAPHPRRQCWLRPSLAFTPRCAPLSAPLPTPSAACSARLPSPPPALTATQSPWRLPSAGFTGVDSPSLLPWVLSFPTACRGFGFHTPRIDDAGYAISTFGVQLSAHPSPFGRPVLVGPSVCRTDTRHPSCPWPCKATLVLHRYTSDTRLPLPKTRTDTQPTCAHDGRLDTCGCVCPNPYTPRYRNLRRHPGPGIPDRAPLWPVHKTRSDHIRASDKTEIASPRPIW